MKNSRRLYEIKLKGLPPTVNNLYGYGRSSVYKKESAREWQEGTTEAMRQEWEGKCAIKSEVELRVKFKVKNQRKWDLDNRLKALQDCLEKAGIIRNDNQIKRLEAEREKGDEDITEVILLEA